MYYIKMTQEEIDAHWLVFRRVISENRDILSNVVDICKCFSKYSTYKDSDVDAINCYCGITSTPYIKINEIDVSVIEKIQKRYGVRDTRPRTSEELKYIVGFDNKDLAIINTVSNNVGGYPDRTLRKHITGRNLMCSRILFTIFGYKEYIITGYAQGQFIFAR